MRRYSRTWFLLLTCTSQKERPGHDLDEEASMVVGLVVPRCTTQPQRQPEVAVGPALSPAVGGASPNEGPSGPIAARPRSGLTPSGAQSHSLSGPQRIVSSEEPCNQKQLDDAIQQLGRVRRRARAPVVERVGNATRSGAADGLPGC